MIISNQLVIREVDDKTMIINLKNGKVTVVDEIGSLFWNALSEGNKEAVFEKIISEYDVEQDVLESDYITFVEKMKDLEIVW